jgi:hypothetical protein
LIRASTGPPADSVGRDPGDQRSSARQCDLHQDRTSCRVSRDPPHFARDDVVQTDGIGWPAGQDHLARRNAHPTFDGQWRVEQRHPECRTATLQARQLTPDVVLHHAAQQQRTGVVALRQRQVAACHDVGQRATANHPPRFDQHHRVRKLRHLVQRMRHV